jgi:hypothetical protein
MTNYQGIAAVVGMIVFLTCCLRSRSCPCARARWRRSSSPPVEPAPEALYEVKPAEATVFVPVAAPPQGFVAQPTAPIVGQQFNTYESQAVHYGQQPAYGAASPVSPAQQTNVYGASAPLYSPSAYVSTPPPIYNAPVLPPPSAQPPVYSPNPSAPVPDDFQLPPSPHHASEHNPFDDSTN